MRMEKDWILITPTWQNTHYENGKKIEAWYTPVDKNHTNTHSENGEKKTESW